MSDEVVINVLCDQSQLFIPNTFSPNGDGENDVFYPRGIGLKNIKSFRIYSRWGELVYERKNILLNEASSAWDGTFKGNLLNPDVFVYVVEAVCDGGELMTWKGDVSLIR
jgi:gliding motility-associated-like protein